MSRTRHAGPPSNAGFTLIELMIAVVVIGILAAIAIPLYGDSVTRSKIIDGTTKLGDFRTQMEKYFMDNRTYINGAACGVPNPAVAANDNFQITCVSAPRTAGDLHGHGDGDQQHVGVVRLHGRPGERQDVVRSGRQIYESRMLGRTQGRVLLMFARAPPGSTLIELMIGLAIAGLLLVLAMPSYSVWIADGQIRNAAESIASGMRYAQSQAVARNSAVAFILTPATGWSARLEIDASILQSGGLRRGSAQTTQTPVPAAATTVTFSSLGGIVANADASATLTEVDVTSATGVAGARNLNVLVGGGASGVVGQGTKTGIKICDPKWPATDPKGCPA